MMFVTHKTLLFIVQVSKEIDKNKDERILKEDRTKEHLFEG